MTTCRKCGNPDKHPFRDLCSPCTLAHYAAQLAEAKKVAA